MSAPPIRFGTDGWRGVMGGEFTAANVRRVALALALKLEREGSAGKGVAVGYDRRLDSGRFAAEFAGVLAVRGIPVLLPADYLPTPVLSFAVASRGLAAGVMVTASHNPPEYNGIKLKENYGGPSTAETNAAIEALLASEAVDGDAIPALTLKDGEKRGVVGPLDCRAAYEMKLRRLVDFEKAGRAGTVAFDAMHGCGAGWTDDFLSSCGCTVRPLRTEYDPGFGGFGPEPVEERLGGLMAAVSGGGARLGLANDGDADRIAAIDERGRFFSPQRILAVFTRYLWEAKGHKGAIAKTVSATALLDLMARKYGCEVFETPIGFRHTARLMTEREILIGGEESGAVGIGAHLPERDGVANALLLAEICGATGRGLREYAQEIFDEFGYFTYKRRDLRPGQEEIAAARKLTADLDAPSSLCGLAVEKTVRTDGLKFVRSDSSWLLIRPSGTEPLLRIYAEARSEAEVGELLEEGTRLAFS